MNSKTEWLIGEQNQFDLAAVERLGNKLLTGNGFLGYRGTLEEFSKNEKTAVIAAGLYDQVGDLWREPVNFPNGGFVQVYSRDQVLHLLKSKVIKHEQYVDLKNACHQRDTVFELADGNQVHIRSKRFVSLERLNLICIQYQISAVRPCRLTLKCGIDGDVWDLNGPHLERFTPHHTAEVISLSAFTHQNKVPLSVSQAVIYSSAQAEIIEPGETSVMRQINVEAGPQVFCLHVFITHSSGLDSDDPLSDSIKTCLEAKQIGFDPLFLGHCRLWEKRWADCDVKINGDPDAEQALRFSLYHLLSIVPTHTEKISIPARGLSGQVYKGGIFWDTEIFMLPFFNATFPPFARNLLLYRYHTLDGARRKAKEYGFRGAFFAWESQDSGDDACTLFNVTDVFTNRPMRTYFRDKQIHISADIVYAFWQYAQTTADNSIWFDGGAEVVFECARFYLSCCYYHPERERYEFLDVTGPDEYHERVHNNAFTNHMVQHCFEVCCRVAAWMEAEGREQYRKIVHELQFADDLQRIKNIKDKVFRPDLLPEGEVVPQFDGYFLLEDLSVPALLERKQHPHEYLGGGNGLATTTRILKQADVILEMALFASQYSLETKKANWEFYEVHTEHGSSLSACSYAMIAAQIGKTNWAYRYFMKTATIDIRGEGKQYVGPLYIGGTHPAANGGAWMALMAGFCGLSFAEHVLELNPQLPKEWQSVFFPLTFRGQKLRLNLSHRHVEVEALNPLSQAVNIRLFGNNYCLPEDGKLIIPINKEEG